MIQFLQLLVGLAILVFIHELGHFGFSRLFGVRVDKFYLFFNPKFSLFRAKKMNGKWRFRFFSRNLESQNKIVVDSQGKPVYDSAGNQLYETIDLSALPEDDWRRYPEKTEWGIGWLPLGGYCKIAGMIDESMDKAQLQKPAQSWEYRGVSAPKRLLIISGGVLMNFLFALLVYAAVLFTWGEKYIPLKSFKYGFDFTDTAQQFGFRDGDMLTAADNENIDRFNEQNIRKLLSAKSVQIIRNQKDTSILLPDNFSETVIFSKESFIIPRFPFVIAEFVEGSTAQQAGLLPGDSLVSVNDTAYSSFYRFAQAISNHKQKPVWIGFYRHGEKHSIAVTTNANGIIGVRPYDYSRYFSTIETHYTFLDAIPAGITLGINKLKGYVSDFQYMFSKKGIENLGGFKSMTQLYPAQWDWQNFWYMTAFLSVILAFMNFLPIPALDGGHFIFILYEIILCRKPSQQFMERAQIAGMVFLIALMLFANLNDFI